MISSPLFASSQFKLSKMANFLLLIFCFFPIFLPKLAAVEQTLIIDFEKGPSHSTRPRSGDYPPDGFGNLLTIEKGNRVRQSRGDKLPNSLQELNELILNMDKAYARRFEQLSKRLDRLEANQLNFRHAALAEWSAFSVDKRIRLFSHMKNGWGEAEQICRAHSGQLLQIESADENRRISEYLKGIDGIYWIGMQRTLQFNISSVSSNYSNFDDGELGKRENLLDDPMRRCVAIQSREAEDGGRWLSRECGEKLAFICQI